ncbi:MAG TPA: hypothetical protein VHX88_00380 [Solirubrobacteraceae bacterium]|jgi:hypothetical protein|nr:hypothetical protein [Solirubrobacteraceae bacterium]
MELREATVPVTSTMKSVSTRAWRRGSRLEHADLVPLVRAVSGDEAGHTRTHDGDLRGGRRGGRAETGQRVVGPEQ